MKASLEIGREWKTKDEKKEIEEQSASGFLRKGICLFKIEKYKTKKGNYRCPIH